MQSMKSRVVYHPILTVLQCPDYIQIFVRETQRVHFCCLCCTDTLCYTLATQSLRGETYTSSQSHSVHAEYGQGREPPRLRLRHCSVDCSGEFCGFSMFETFRDIEKVNTAQEIEKAVRVILIRDHHDAGQPNPRCIVV